MPLPVQVSLLKEINALADTLNNMRNPFLALSFIPSDVVTNAKAAYRIHKEKYQHFVEMTVVYHSKPKHF